MSPGVQSRTSPSGMQELEHHSPNDRGQSHVSFWHYPNEGADGVARYSGADPDADEYAKKIFDLSALEALQPLMAALYHFWADIIVRGYNHPNSQVVL